VSDLPENVDLQWLGRTMLAMREELASVREDMMVMAAVLNRVDATVSRLVPELRAMRSQHDRMRARLDALTKAETDGA
jgi:predicted  nucleic acid-binding Zn-ribbon protein